MTITLSAEQERLIPQARQAGGYEEADDVIARGLQVLRVEDEPLREQQSEVAGKIDGALEQFARRVFHRGRGARRHGTAQGRMAA